MEKQHEVKIAKKGLKKIRGLSFINLNVTEFGSKNNTQTPNVELILSKNKRARLTAKKSIGKANNKPNQYD